MDVACLAHCLTDVEHQAFERDGFLVIEGAIPEGMLKKLNQSIERILANETVQNSGDELRIWDVLGQDDLFLELIDWPSIFPKVWGVLKWNIHLCHTELVVTPPSSPDNRRVKRHLRWFQDGDRLNWEVIEAIPAPRISVKTGYFLTDLMHTGCGNPSVIPGSHLKRETEFCANSISGSDGAIDLCVPAGTAVIFDRRLWRAQSPNCSDTTRRALFMGYSHRWFHPTVDMNVSHLMKCVDPIRRQLLGATTSNLAFTTPTDADVPLRDWVREHLGDQAMPDRSLRNLT